MANPLLDMPLLLGHSGRVVFDKEQQIDYLKFANAISDSSESDMETLRGKVRNLRIVDTNGNAKYDEQRQYQRLEYVAALGLLQTLGLTKNADAFVYTPIHFHGIRIESSNRVSVFDYWRDQCYTLYSYVIHEYRRATSAWTQQARNCVNDSCNMQPGMHLREFFPVMTKEGLLSIASNANRAYVALKKCHRLYKSHVDDGEDDLAVLAQCGDLGHITSLRKYLTAFIHEVVVVAAEFHADDPCVITDDMDLHARYAQCVSENYAYLAKADPTWFAPDRQTSYQRRVALRAKTWETFAQILAARHELIVLQTYAPLRGDADEKMRGSVIDRLVHHSSAHVHQPLRQLSTSVDTIEDAIISDDHSQLPSSPDETALRLYVSVMALKLIDTYNLYIAVFNQKSDAVVTPYSIPATTFEFTICTSASFAREIDTMRNDLILACGSISFVLSATDNRNYLSTLMSPFQQNSATSDDLLGPCVEDIAALREKRLQNRTALRDGVGVTSPVFPIASNVAYELGVIEERVHFLRDLKKAHGEGMSLEEIIARFDSSVLQDTYECYDAAHQLLDIT